MNGALERPAPQRQGYLEDACAGDTELRAGVDSLLACHDEAGDFIEASAIDSLAEYTGPTHDLPPDTRIGIYRITTTIGESRGSGDGAGALRRGVAQARGTGKSR